MDSFRPVVAVCACCSIWYFGLEPAIRCILHRCPHCGTKPTLPSSWSTTAFQKLYMQRKAARGSGIWLRAHDQFRVVLRDDSHLSSFSANFTRIPVETYPDRKSNAPQRGRSNLLLSVDSYSISLALNATQLPNDGNSVPWFASPPKAYVAPIVNSPNVSPKRSPSESSKLIWVNS